MSKGERSEVDGKKYAEFKGPLKLNKIIKLKNKISRGHWTAIHWSALFYFN